MGLGQTIHTPRPKPRDWLSLSLSLSLSLLARSSSTSPPKAPGSMGQLSHQTVSYSFLITASKLERRSAPSLGNFTGPCQSIHPPDQKTHALDYSTRKKNRDSNMKPNDDGYDGPGPRTDGHWRVVWMIQPASQPAVVWSNS